MRILELDKKYCREYYNGKYQPMIDAEDGVIYDDERIRHAFAFGKGTEKDMQRYMNDNRKYARFFDLDRREFI